MGTVTFDAARRSTPPRKRNATASRQGQLWRFLRVRITLLSDVGRIDTTQPKVRAASCGLRDALQPSVLWATSIRGVYIFGSVASVGLAFFCDVIYCDVANAYGFRPTPRPTNLASKVGFWPLPGLSSFRNPHPASAR